MKIDRIILRQLLTASALASSLVTAPVMAQDQASADGEIVVTGEREVVLDTRSETGSRLNLSVRETPATLDVLTQERFLERGLRTTNEALNTAPGVTALDTGGGTSFSMRGFGGAAVSVNFDGVHQPSTMTQRNLDGFAFERVEVLKGPSSVLYGEGAIGGSINYVTKKPVVGSTAFQGLAQYGSRDTFRLAADANVPVSDTVAARAVFSYAGTDGYIDRAEQKSVTANVGLMFEPSDRLSVLLQFEHASTDDGPRYWGTPLVPVEIAIDPRDTVTTASGRVLDRARQNINYQYLDSYVRSDNTWLRSQVEWRISDAWTLRNDLSYNRSERTWRDAWNYSYAAPTATRPTPGITRAADYIHNPLNFWNERIALSSDQEIGGRRNRFLIGYEHTENDHVSLRRFGPTQVVDLDNANPGLAPAVTPENFPGAGNFTDSAADIRIDAVFAEDAFNVTDNLLIVAGGRYEKMRVHRNVRDYNTNTVAAFDRTYEPFSYRLGAVYDLAPATQIYAQWTEAAAPVGTLVLISLPNSEFKLTKGKSAEVGLKSSLLDGRVSMTLAGYWIEQSDIITRDPNNPSLSVQGGVQATKGVELAMTAGVASGLRFDINATVLDAKFEELIEAGGADRSGNTPPNVPEAIVNVFAVYQIPTMPLKLTAGMRYSSEIFGDNANTTKIDDYTVFDASIGYTFDFGDLTLRARNLTNNRYVEWGGTNSVYLAAPRSVDLTFRTGF